ncbi:MAG: TIGR00725 family protein [Candidatus Omnitrophota bacterium]|nr:TIGR00725 family protein [Candidatus Omnitrophota bacterium]
MRKTVIAVIGGHACDQKTTWLARSLGKELAALAEVLVTGGLTGVMAAACEGFKSAGGLTVGILPGYEKTAANPFVDIVIPTGMGLARNVLVVTSADVVVALPGAAGTLSEIAYCVQFKIPVVSFLSWDIPGVIPAKNIMEVIKKVKKHIRQGKT